MSSAQLDKVIADVVATFGAWGRRRRFTEMRKGWERPVLRRQADGRAKTEKVDARRRQGRMDHRARRVGRPRHPLPPRRRYVLGSIHSHRDMCERLPRAAQRASRARLSAGAGASLSRRRRRRTRRLSVVVAELRAETDRYRRRFGGRRPDGRGLLALKQHGDPMPACAVPCPRGSTSRGSANR